VCAAVSLSVVHGMEHAFELRHNLSFRAEGSTASYIHDTKHEKTIAVIPSFDCVLCKSMA
jgi:hypothetical protein